MNKNANTYGQLGLRHVDFPAPSSASGNASQTRITVELIPKSVADPYARASPYSRVPVPNNSTSENLDTVDDKHIRFSDSLFEIPALKDVKVSQIASGRHSSHVNTDAGRVLGWGANEFGYGLPCRALECQLIRMSRQIGLGSGITLDTIIVPTEVVLTRNISTQLKTKCLQIFAGVVLMC